MHTLILLIVLLIPVRAFADAAVTQPVSNPDFEFGVEAVQAKDWGKAVTFLSSVVKVEPTNADAQNLLGYAYRNQKKYDLAFVHYNAALKIDPKHKAAHEYVGEAYVLTGNKAKAQEHLAALERICGKGCEEYQDLARALAQAK